MIVGDALTRLVQRSSGSIHVVRAAVSPLFGPPSTTLALPSNAVYSAEPEFETTQTRAERSIASQIEPSTVARPVQTLEPDAKRHGSSLSENLPVSAEDTVDLAHFGSDVAPFFPSDETAADRADQRASLAPVERTAARTTEVTPKADSQGAGFTENSESRSIPIATRRSPKARQLDSARVAVHDEAMQQVQASSWSPAAEYHSIKADVALHGEPSLDDAAVVHVTIGRVDVRAVAPPALPPPTNKPAAFRPRLTLEDYLRGGKRS